MDSQDGYICDHEEKERKNDTNEIRSHTLPCNYIRTGAPSNKATLQKHTEVHFGI